MRVEAESRCPAAARATPEAREAEGLAASGEAEEASEEAGAGPRDPASAAAEPHLAAAPRAPGPPRGRTQGWCPNGRRPRG